MLDTDRPRRPQPPAVPERDFAAGVEAGTSKAPVAIIALVAIVVSIILLLVQAAA